MTTLLQHVCINIFTSQDDKESKMFQIEKKSYYSFSEHIKIIHIYEIHLKLFNKSFITRGHISNYINPLLLK